MPDKLEQQEQERFNFKLAGDVESGAFSSEQITRLSGRHDHIKRAYINGLSVVQALNMTQNKAMVYNKLYHDSNLNINSIYDEAMKITNLSQSIAFMTGQFNSVDEAIEFCRYYYTDEDRLGMFDDNHEVSQARAKAVALISKEEAGQFVWLSQARMLEIIKDAKQGLGTSELTSADIHMARRFDREYNLTALPILSALYGKPVYGTENFNALIESALKFDYYPQVTLLESMIQNARTSGALRPAYDGGVITQEALQEIKGRKDAIVDAADDMTPEHPLIRSLTQKALNVKWDELQNIANQKAEMRVRTYDGTNFVDAPNNLTPLVVELREEDIINITASIYDYYMNIIIARVKNGETLASALEFIAATELASDAPAGGEEESKGDDFVASSVVEEEEQGEIVASAFVEANNPEEEGEEANVVASSVPEEEDDPMPETQGEEAEQGQDEIVASVEANNPEQEQDEEVDPMPENPEGGEVQDSDSTLSGDNLSQPNNVDPTEEQEVQLSGDGGA